jgi:hypothetical protein
MEAFKQGQPCTECYKGRLQAPRTKETFQENRFKRKIVFWECSLCSFQYQWTDIQVADTINFSD